MSYSSSGQVEALHYFFFKNMKIVDVFKAKIL